MAGSEGLDVSSKWNAALLNSFMHQDKTVGIDLRLSQDCGEPKLDICNPKIQSAPGLQL
mgnify:CR=1 FL=1|jgi:hypothetical protein